MKTDHFQSCRHCWVFQICWHIECSTFTVSSFRIWNSSTGILLPPLALLVVMLPQAYLTSHSRMSGSRWVITPSWLSGSWRSFFFKYKFIYFNWRLITLQYFIGFAIHQHESTTGTHVNPILNSVPPPSPYHPSGSSHAPVPSNQYPAFNLDWQFISYMILCMFQCHSPKSSYPLPLPQSPKDCSRHLCLFCCLAYRVIITIFLNSIYMR